MIEIINITYSRAYKEVIEIIESLNDYEYMKIPKEIIDFYKNNMNKDYKFIYNPKLALNEQNISIEAKAIIVSLFIKYFANEKEKEIIKDKLRKNYIKSEEEKEKRYNIDNLFKNSSTNEKNEEILVVKKEKNSFFMKIIKKVINMFKK